jgi:uncharacterized protein (TIGR02266 family)
LKPKDGGERRSDERVAAKLLVKYDSLDEFVLAYTTDISRGGVFIGTDAPLSAGCVVKLEIVLPDEGPSVHIEGRVLYSLDPAAARAHKRNAGMGIKFLPGQEASVADQLAKFLEAHGERSRTARAKPAKILFVDDSQAYLDVVEGMLTKWGHKVTVAISGMEALGKAVQDPPDLIVSDIQMPGMDGWQFLRLVRAYPSLADIPCIVLTTRSSDPDRARGYELGVDDFIAKPFAEQELMVRVQRALARTNPRSRNG